MTKPKMVERLAIALACVWHNRKIDPEYILTPCTGGRVFVDMARAALEELQDPSDEMFEGVDSTGKMWKELNSRIVFVSMIDGALWYDQ